MPLDEESSRARAKEYYAQIISMIGDINYASAILNDPNRVGELAKGRLEAKEAPTPFESLWRELPAGRDIYLFSEQLLISIKRKREEIEKYVESVQIKSMAEIAPEQLAAEAEELEQQASSILSTLGSSLDLKPARIDGRRIWVVVRDRSAHIVDKNFSRLKQIIQYLSQIRNILSTGRFHKGYLPQAKKQLDIITNAIKTYKTALARAVGKARIKSTARRLVITASLVPLLVGAFPSKTTSTVLKLKSNEQIARQILGDEFNEQQIQRILQASGFVDGLIKILDEHKAGSIPYNELPDYIQEMISDGVLDIAIFVGAEWEHIAPIHKDEIRTIELGQRHIVLRLRYIDKIKDAIKAFGESDFIHVTSHSRYGLGWALTGEGMENPMRMQTHPVKILKSGIHGYPGRILKDLGDYAIVQSPGDEDIRSIKPKRSYQLISMDSCKSGNHFLETIRRMRQGLPTTIIYTNADTHAQSGASAILDDMFNLKSVEEITKDLNDAERVQQILNFNNRNDTYEMVVLNADAGSPESTNYIGNNIPNSITFFYGVEIVK